VRVQTDHHAGGGGVVDGTFNQIDQAKKNRQQTNEVDFRVRGALSLDVRDQTEYGVLRSYFRIGMEQTTPAGGQGAGPFWDRAFIQWAGFTVGKSQSFYDTVTYGGAYSYHNVRTVADTGASGWNVWAYTANFGNGMSATVSLEDPNRNRSVCDATQACWTYGGVTYDNAYGAQSATNNGFRVPDLITNLRWDQSWGYISASTALHEVAGAYYLTGNNVNNGHPDDKWGWAFGIGANVAAPTTPGSRFGINFQWSEGAIGYGAATPSQIWAILEPGQSVGLGWATEGIYDGTGQIQLTRAWNIIAFYEHKWNARWKSSIFGGYVSIEYNDTAKNIILSHLPGAAGSTPCGVPVGGAVWPPITIVAGNGNSCDPDFSFYQIGSRTQWNPHPLLDIGLEVVYTHLNTAFEGLGVVAPGAPQNNVLRVEDQDVWSAFFRWQRNFYP
jgi:hypothetical protein